VSKCPGFFSLSLDVAVCIGDVLTFFNVAMCGTVPSLEGIWEFLRLKP
jgi:hypothetical protein